MSHPVVVLGLDAASFTIIDPLLERGRMPNLAALLRRGARGTLRSVLPPNSAPAWVSFMTGTNPAAHGIYGFRTLDLGRYSCFAEHLVNASWVAGATIFDLAGAAGRRVGAVGIPVTYPPWEVNGVMVSGYPTPDERRAFAVPRGLESTLGRLTPLRIDQVTVSDPETQIATLRYQLDKAEEVLRTLCRHERFDFLTFVTQVPDSAGHKFWKFRVPAYPGVGGEERARFGGLLDEIYTRLDRLVGVAAEVAGDAYLFVISDHGSGPRPTRAMHLSAALRAAGYLAPRGGGQVRVTRSLSLIAEWAKENLPLRDWVKKTVPARLKATFSAVTTSAAAIDWTRTRAYRVPLQHPAEGINLNQRGRQPLGIVEPREAGALRDELAAYLLDLRDPASGERLVERVYRKEELYRGPHAANAPDLVLLVNPTYDCGPGLERLVAPVPPTLLRTISGYHTMDGILVAAGPGIAPGANLGTVNLIDLPATLLYTLGLPVPTRFDGRVLTEAFEPAYAQARPVEFGDQNGRADPAAVLSREEEEEMQRALRGLGYLS